MTRYLLAMSVIYGVLAGSNAGDKENFALSKDEQEVLDLTNKERKDACLPPLKPNEKLFKAARGHSANMAKQDKLDHKLDDKDPGDRLKDVGYAFASWAENCAMGQRMAAEAVETWVKSTDGHKENLLSKHTEIGIGVAKNADGTKYWTQVFATPAK
jgi:uncharacterized protein YkwD